MAGAGYKLFNTGDVLTAAQVNTYLMQQTVMVFADATARTTALSSVLAEGMCSYLQDTNQMEVYDGSAWVNATGDITAVTASSPLTGGGTTGAISLGIQDGTTAQKGAVQLTDSTASTSTTTAATPNSVKTAYDLANAAVPKSTLTTKGDVLTYSTAVTRLGVGSDGTLLVAASGQTTGLQWTNSINNINVTSSTVPANGVYLPAANTLGLATNTTLAFRINAAQEVGIPIPSTGFSLLVGKNPTGGTNTYQIASTGTIQSDVTSNHYGFYSAPNTAATAFTLGAINHFFATSVGIGASSTVTTQHGFYVPSNFTTATNNIAFRSDIASGSNRWNIYMVGTAANYFAGQTTVGSTSLTLGSSSAAQQFGVVAGAATTVGAVIRGAASQTANLQEWQNSAGTVLAKVDSTGNIVVGSMAIATSSVATIHISNGTIPSANPTGGGVLYVEAGALKFRGSSGTITTIANA